MAKPCGPELVDPSVGALASTISPRAEIGGWASWTRALELWLVHPELKSVVGPHGPDLKDPSLGALASTVASQAEIDGRASWTRARGSEARSPGWSPKAAPLFSFSPKLVRVPLALCNVLLLVCVMRRPGLLLCASLRLRYLQLLDCVLCSFQFVLPWVMRLSMLNLETLFCPYARTPKAVPGNIQ